MLAGLAYAAHAVGAERGYVYVRSEYPAALERLKAAAAEATAAGHLGRNLHGSATRFEVDVVEGAGSDVAGEETALIHALEGRRGSSTPETALSDLVRAIRGTDGGQQCRDTRRRAMDHRPWR